VRDLEARLTTTFKIQDYNLVLPGSQIDPDEDIVGCWVSLILFHADLHALW
jgi:hypothetical protein